MQQGPAAPPQSPSGDAAHWLTLAARIACRAAGRVEPNPMVGAVIVRDGRLIGMGHHRRFGGLHAEREALANCIARGEDPRGATVYCTLEPCRHVGKQPPCTDALIAARVAGVVYARADPGHASGGGADVLCAAGIPCDLCPHAPNATRLSDPFVHRVTTGLPWVIAKWAQTIDGRIATRSGESKWISAPRSRARVHRLRARVDAVLTGIGTVRADDPLLTARGVRTRRVASRVVVDADLDTPTDAALVRTARDVPTIVACSKDLLSAGIAAAKKDALEAAGVTLLGIPERSDQPGRLRLDMLLAALAERFQVTNVLLEAGAGLTGSLLDAGLVQELRVYVAPLLLGDEHAMSPASGRVADSLTQGRRFELLRAKPIGSDVELVYRQSTPPIAATHADAQVG